MSEIETDDILEIEPTEEVAAPIDPFDIPIESLIDILNIPVSLMNKSKSLDFKKSEHRIFYIVKTINENNKKITKTFSTLDNAENEFLIKEICGNKHITLIHWDQDTDKEIIIKERKIGDKDD